MCTKYLPLQGVGISSCGRGLVHETIIHQLLGDQCDVDCVGKVLLGYTQTDNASTNVCICHFLQVLY